MSRVHRAFRIAGGGGASGPLPGVVARVPGASWLVDDRSARDGAAVGTFAGSFIAVPGAGGPDRVWFFTQADAFGVQRGFLPLGAYPSLAGFSQHAVPLAHGVLDRDAVASALASAWASVYSSVTLGGAGTGIVTARDAGIASGLAFTGDLWGARGGGGAWGMQRVDGGTVDFEMTDASVTYGVGPALSATTWLRAIEVFIGPAVSVPIRAAVYLGGGYRAPAGSGLGYDFGQIPPSTTPDGWLRLFVSGDVVLPSLADIQVTLKGPPGSGTFVRHANGGGNIGDYTGGLYNATPALGTDPAVPFPAIFPSGGAGFANGYVNGVRLIYETSPVAAGGSWGRRWGIHQPASTLPTTTSPTANVLMGGGYPPQVEHMRLSAVEVAATNDASMRLGVLQDGAPEDPPEDPNGGVLLWDAGRGPAGPGLADGWYRRTAPTGGGAIMVDRTRRIWWWSRDNGTATYRFATSGQEIFANPITNPMDWPPNVPGTRPEYETTAANPHISTDPAVPLESVFVSDPSDFLPGNFPPGVIEFAVDGIELSAA